MLSTPDVLYMHNAHVAYRYMGCAVRNLQILSFGSERPIKIDALFFDPKRWNWFFQLQFSKKIHPSV
jgi:hypothetical protein